MNDYNKQEVAEEEYVEYMEDQTEDAENEQTVLPEEKQPPEDRDRY